MLLAFVLKRNRAHIDRLTTIVIPTASALSATSASSTVTSAGAITHFHNKCTVCGAKCFPFLSRKVPRRVGNIDPVNDVSIHAVSSASASTASASAAASSPSTSASTTSGPRVDCIDSSLLSPLLLIFELGRAVDSGNLLGEISTCAGKVSWVLLVDDDLRGQ